MSDKSKIELTKFRRKRKESADEILMWCAVGLSNEPGWDVLGLVEAASGEIARLMLAGQDKPKRHDKEDVT